MANCNSNTIEGMRSRIKKVYSYGKENSWTEKCSKMSGSQVIAVFLSFKKRKKI